MISFLKTSRNLIFGQKIICGMNFLYKMHTFLSSFKKVLKQITRCGQLLQHRFSYLCCSNIYFYYQYNKMKSMKLMTKAMFVIAFMLISSASWAQIKTPQPSPLGKVTQTIGLTDVTITYSRPSVKGRTIFGDLVQYDKRWRTGANATTKINFSDEVTVEGTKIPAGEYVLLTIPGKDEWTIIINKNLKLSGDGGKEYKTEEDVANFKVKPTKLSDKVETFTINFTDLTMNAANIELAWENTSVKFKVIGEVDTKVMAEIQEKMAAAEATSTSYYQAARYYFENNKDKKKALEWINKAIEKDKEPKYWMVHVQAKIQAANGDYKKAIETAKRSSELAKAAENPEYVAMNEKLISEWNAKSGGGKKK